MINNLPPKVFCLTFGGNSQWEARHFCWGIVWTSIPTWHFFWRATRGGWKLAWQQTTGNGRRKELEDECCVIDNRQRTTERGENWGGRLSGIREVYRMFTNCKHGVIKKESQKWDSFFVPRAGIEPARIASLVFETNASTNSAIGAGRCFCEYKGTKLLINGNW